MDKLIKLLGETLIQAERELNHFGYVARRDSYSQAKIVNAIEAYIKHKESI